MGFYPFSDKKGGFGLKSAANSAMIEARTERTEGRFFYLFGEMQKAEDKRQKSSIASPSPICPLTSVLSSATAGKDLYYAQRIS